MLKGLFSSGDPGPCPICGAPNTSCIGEKDNVVRTTAFSIASQDEKARFHSVARVFEVSHNGAQVLKYAVGHPIPLIEAIRQGQVRPGDLTAEDKSELQKHIDKGLLTLTELKSFLAPPKDKMLRPENIVTK